MGTNTKGARSRSFTIDDLLQLLNSTGINGVKLSPATDDINRDIGPLESVISRLRDASATNGPLTQAVEVVTHLCKHNKKDDESQHFWKALEDADISIEALVELLNHLADSDPSPLSIAAACLYFALLRIPGAFLYHFFSAMVFRTCITSLKKWIYSVGGTNSISDLIVHNND